MYAQDRRQPTCCSQVGHLDAKFLRVYCSGPVSVNSSHLKRVREVGCFHMWLFSQAPRGFPLFFTPRLFFCHARRRSSLVRAYGRGSDLRTSAAMQAQQSARDGIRCAGPPAGRGATIPRAGLWDPGCEARPRRAYERPPRRCAPWHAPPAKTQSTPAATAQHGAAQPRARNRLPRASGSPPSLTAARAPAGALAVSTPTEPGAALDALASGWRLHLRSRHEVRPHAARRAVGAVGGLVHPVQGAQEDPQGVHQRRRLLSRCRGRFHDEAAQCGRLGRHLLREPGA